MSAPLVTLLTDFGTEDPYVGVMKGVMLARCPELRFVDLSHSIPPQDVELGGFWLERCRHWFPPGTIHLAVVDPGVGTQRSAVVARIDNQIFVGPHAGLLDRTLRVATSAELYVLQPEPLGLVLHSSTFHGRDLFGPVAAELAAGRLLPHQVGVPCQPSRACNISVAPPTPEGSVVFVDHFGNLVSDIDRTHLNSGHYHEVSLLDRCIPLCHTYADVAPGQLLALVSSFDTIEVAQRNGHAAHTLGVGRGTAIRLRTANP